MAAKPALRTKTATSAEPCEAVPRLQVTRRESNATFTHTSDERRRQPACWREARAPCAAPHRAGNSGPRVALHRHRYCHGHLRVQSRAFDPLAHHLQSAGHGTDQWIKLGHARRNRAGTQFAQDFAASYAASTRQSPRGISPTWEPGQKVARLCARHRPRHLADCSLAHRGRRNRRVTRVA